MQVVKLNKSHNLYHWGYRHALRFQRRGPASIEVLTAIRTKFGNDFGVWRAFRSNKRSPYWIGFRDEQTLTFALLCIK